MRSPVPEQVAPLCVGLSADVTAELAHLGVRHFVLLQVRLPGKTFPTPGTTEGLLSGVQGFVLFQVSTLGESLPTVATGKGSLTVVVHHVLLQVLLVLEHLPTELTGDGLHGDPYTFDGLLLVHPQVQQVLV